MNFENGTVFFAFASIVIALITVSVIVIAVRVVKQMKKFIHEQNELVVQGGSTIREFDCKNTGLKEKLNELRSLNRVKDHKKEVFREQFQVYLDEINASLTRFDYDMKLIESRFAEKDVSSKNVVDRLKFELKNIRNLVSSATLSLNVKNIHHEDLMTAVRKYFESRNIITSIEHELSSSVEEFYMDEELKIIIFRAVEAVSDFAIENFHSGKVQLEVDIADNRFSLSLNLKGDVSSGLDKEKAHVVEMEIMERLENFNGQFACSIDSKSRFRASLEVPLAGKNELQKMAS